MPQQPQQQSFAAKVFAQLVTLVGTLLGYLVALVMPKPVVPKPTAVRLTAPTKAAAQPSSSSASANFFDNNNKELPVTDESQMQACLAKFDTNRDGQLSRTEFDGLVGELLVGADGKPFPLSKDEVDQIFAVFDANNDGAIDAKEFQVAWNKWVEPMNHPKTALIVVDVQNDFISGSLALIHCPAKDDGAKVVPVVNKLKQENKFDLCVFTLDSHPPGHCSFHSCVHKHKLAKDSPIKAADAKLFDVVKLKGPPSVDQKLWPDHCVQGSWGEELHEGLAFDKENDKVVHKGTNINVDSYSGFYDNAKLSETPLLKILKDQGVNTVFVCGLAYDVCVGSTALHAAELGFRTIVVEDACAGVSVEGIAEMKAALTKSGCAIVQSADVPDLASGKNRDVLLALNSLNVLDSAKSAHLSIASRVRNSLGA